MDFLSLAAFLALTTSPAPAPAKVEASCCQAEKTKAPVKVAQTDGYVCPLTGAILPCPSCCPANAK